MARIVDYTESAAVVHHLHPEDSLIMAGPPKSPISLLDEDFSRKFQRDLFRVISTHYTETLKAARAEHHEKFVSWIWPLQRRAKIEAAIETVSRLHDIPSRVEANRSGDPHTVIESTHFYLTESRVEKATEVPRPAIFREAHAMHNYPLFDPFVAGDGEKYSVILIHGPSPSDPAKLGFALLRFPSPDGKRWLDEAVDLFSRFAEVLTTATDFPVEQIAPPAPPKFRTNQETKDEQ